MVQEPSLPSIGAVIGAKYRIERLIGTGGMGAVFDVTHQVTGKHFAIKWLLPEVSAQPGAVKRFIREAQVAGRFDHPNVIEVYDIGQEGSSYYMVMELLLGESLAERLQRAGGLTIAEVCSVLLPCIAGVAAAHAAGIIHRDLKPSNIFLRKVPGGTSEQPKVLDFGIARLSSVPGSTDSTMTKRGAVVGTPHYMAPEQLRGLEIDTRVDIYAFGVILYEALSGQRPFGAESFADLVLSVMTQTPPPLESLRSDLPAALCAVIAKAMARDRDARFASLPELEAALRAFSAPSFGKAIELNLGQQPAPSNVVSPATPFATGHASGPQPRPAHSKILIGSVAALMSVVLGLSYFAFQMLHVRATREMVVESGGRTAAVSSGGIETEELDVQPTVQLIAVDAGKVELAPPTDTRSEQLDRSKLTVPHHAEAGRVHRSSVITPLPTVRVLRNKQQVPDMPELEPSAGPETLRPVAPASIARPHVQLGNDAFEGTAVGGAAAPARPRTTLDTKSF